MRKPGNILLLAIVIGALSAALIYRHLRTLHAEIEAARGAPRTTVEVVVAAETIPLGTRIDAKQLRTTLWPADVVPEGAIHDPGAVVNQVARTTIERNQPVTPPFLVPPGGGLLPMMIAEGMRAMSVRVDDVTGVSGFITPNSRVDVMVAGKADGDGNREERSKVILQNVKVLATGKSIEQRDDKPVEVPTVTLLVSPDEAEKLTLAARYEPVRLALRNYRDEDVVGTPGASTATLFETDHAVARPEVPRSERRPRYTVEVILGEKLTRAEVF